MNFVCALTFDDWVKLIPAFSIVVTAGFTIYTLRTWRKSIVGKRRLEVAEEVLMSFREAFSSVGRIRSPLFVSGEVKKTDKNADPDVNERETYAAVLKRIESERDVFARLERAQELSRYYLEPDVSAGIEKFWNIMSKVVENAQMLQMMGVPKTNDIESKEFKEHKARTKIVFYRGAKDEIRAEIGDALAQVEGKCAPILRLNGPA